MDARIETYFTRCEPAQQEIFYYVRQLILDAHAAIEEKFTYMCPFYHFNGLLCYLSLQKKGKRAVLGFCDGFSLSDLYGILRADEGQTQIKHLLLSVKIPEKEIIETYVLEAVEFRKKLKKGKS